MHFFAETDRTNGYLTFCENRMSGKNLVLLQRAKSGLEYYLGNFAKMQKKNPKFLVTTITRSEMVEFEWNFEAFGYIWVHLGKIFFEFWKYIGIPT